MSLRRRCVNAHAAPRSSGGTSYSAGTLADVGLWRNPVWGGEVHDGKKTVAIVSLHFAFVSFLTFLYVAHLKFIREVADEKFDQVTFCQL